MRTPVSIGIIGGGLMGREMAAAIGRWVALENSTVVPVLHAVADTSASQLNWFNRVASVQLLTANYEELLADDQIEAVYIALPHHLHEDAYSAAIDAGKDFLAEKPFGLNYETARRLVNRIEGSKSFVRVSSEMPFFPGAQFAIDYIRSGQLGQPIEAHSAFLHSSDMDRSKPINWKRQQEFCGPTGVMGDLGLHTLHVPLRIGWAPRNVFAFNQNLILERPDSNGSMVACDTIDNASLMCAVGNPAFPLVVETKRLAPGEMNTWRFSAVGLDGGVRFSTRYPQTVKRLRMDDGHQAWEEVQVGSQSVSPTVTGGIFESGFSDAILQMLAAFLGERAGESVGFGCATPREALAAHAVFEAALESSGESAVLVPG